MKDKNDFETEEAYMAYLYNYTLIEAMNSILKSGKIHPSYTSNIKRESISLANAMMDSFKLD
jgi:hypothetical protein